MPHGSPYCRLMVRIQAHPLREGSGLAKHSRAERERRKQEVEATARIQAAWQASVPPAVAKEFAARVAAAQARGPQERPPDMAPGTAPRPPRPGHEPKPKKEPTRSRRSY
jgi:hypothetical protein